MTAISPSAARGKTRLDLGGFPLVLAGDALAIKTTARSRYIVESRRRRLLY